MRSISSLPGAGRCAPRLSQQQLLHAGLLGLLCLAIRAEAAINVGPGGSGLLTFDTLPAVTEWSTLSIAGAAADITTVSALDAAVNSAIHATNVNVPLGVSSTLPPSAAAIARWNSFGLYLQTRPTANAYLVLMATLRNDAGFTQPGLCVKYDWDQKIAPPVDEDIPGHRVFYSVTGLPGSWTLAPELSTFDNNSGAQSLTATLSFGWPPGGQLYVLWVEDNAGGTEGAYTIDNVSVAPLGLPTTITQQPVGTNFNERQVAQLRVAASGTCLDYQWFKNGSPINSTDNPSAITATLNVTNTSSAQYAWSVPQDSGNYHVVVSGATPPPAQSQTVNVTVTADTVPPAFAYAICGGSNEIIVVLSETIQRIGPGGGNVEDPFLWEGLTESGPSPHPGTPSNVVYNGGTQITLQWPNALDPATSSYRVRVNNPLYDTAFVPNALPAGSSIVANCSSNAFVAFNALWRYSDDDVDPGPTWTQTAFDDSAWPIGSGLFDAKRDANGTAGQNCRETTLYGLGAVGTCIRLTSPVTLTNLITSYYRAHFPFNGDPGATVLRLSGKFDDGGVVYLNGTEVWRVGMPAAQTHTTFANRTVNDGDASDTIDLVFPASLVVGDNILAVELHQVNLTSSDLTMGLRVVALTRAPLPPVITAQPQSQNVSPGDTATFSVSATGSGLSYFWFHEGAPVAGANNATLIISNASVAHAGAYTVVVGNVLGTATSAAALLRLAPRPFITDFSPKVGGPGTELTIVGGGFENGRPGDHCVVLFDPALRRPVSLETLSASSNQLVARIRYLPPSLRDRPLQLMLAVGSGGFRELCPPEDEAALAGLEIGPHNWFWVGDDSNMAAAPTPFSWSEQGRHAIETPPPPSFFSGPPTNGVLLLRLYGTWGVSARYSLSARLRRFSTPGQRSDYEVRFDAITFRGSGDLEECANALCVVLRKAFGTSSDFAINGTVTLDGTNALLKVALADGSPIRDGNIDLIGEPPPLVTADVVNLIVTNLWRREVRRSDLPRCYRQLSWELACNLCLDREAAALRFTREALGSFAFTNHCLLPNPGGPGWWLVRRVYRTNDVRRFSAEARLMWVGLLDRVLPQLIPDLDRMLLSVDHLEITLPMEPADPNPATPALNEAVEITDANGVKHFLGEPGFALLPDTAQNPTGFQLLTTALSTDRLPPATNRVRQPAAPVPPGWIQVCPGVLRRSLVGANGKSNVDVDGDGCPDSLRDGNVLGGQKHQGLVDRPTGVAGTELGVDYANSSLQLYTWLLTTNGEVLGAMPGQLVVGPTGDLDGNALGDGPIGAPAPLDPTVRELVADAGGVREELRSGRHPVSFALVEGPITNGSPSLLCVQSFRLKNLWGVDRRAVFDTTLHHWTWRMPHLLTVQKPATRLRMNRDVLTGFVATHTAFPTGAPPVTRTYGRNDVRFFRLGYRMVVPNGYDVLFRLDELHLVLRENPLDPNSPLLLLSSENDENDLRAQFPPGVLSGALPDPLPINAPGTLMEHLDATNAMDVGLGGTGVFETFAMSALQGTEQTLRMEGNVDEAHLLLNNQLTLYCWRLDMNGNLRQETFPFNGASTLALAVTPTPAIPSFEDRARRPIGDPTQLGVTLRAAFNTLDIEFRPPGQIVFDWGGVATLQSATNLLGTYLDVSNCTVSPFLFDITAGPTRFFRLRR